MNLRGGKMPPLKPPKKNPIYIYPKCRNNRNKDTNIYVVNKIQILTLTSIFMYYVEFLSIKYMAFEHF